MLKKIYKNKEGKAFTNPLILSNGATVYYPTPEQLAENGYFPITIAINTSNTMSNIKLSKLSIIEYLGDAWPSWKQKIIESGAWDYWEACTYIETSNKRFLPFLNALTAKEKHDLITKCRY